jgi:hypothetical protein
MVPRMAVGDSISIFGHIEFFYGNGLSMICMVWMADFQPYNVWQSLYKKATLTKKNWDQNPLWQTHLQVASLHTFKWKVSYSLL